ncbi:3-isopropylmalate dehydratase small subunit [Parvularcula maris]|uniref:3-isopropylmalate dehydratase n=1 Tax=Parvularcula maris TaxID=2965077 RepID=A0A9X2RH33_9PROT|nr:3-isopropylmalate dehydratase small subunit [Parvularcula maris]
MTEPFTRLTSRTLALPENNIDTDQIIPAKFLTTTDKEGLGRRCFYSWRFDEAGHETDHPLNKADMSVHRILVAGDNFGCGSSREHAPWALAAFGVGAVISTSFGDIFRSNALKNGLLPVEVPGDTLQRLMLHEGEEVTVDLEAEVLRFGNQEVAFETEPFARRCLLGGTDSLGALLSALPDIEAFEARREERG